MPISARTRIILFKTEATYGVDSAPDASNGFLMTDVSLSPMEGDEVSRDLLLPYMGGQGVIPNGLYVRLKGKVELVGSGAAGTAPKWGPMLKACGTAETINAGVSTVYNPVSDNHSSGTLHFWMGGTRHVATGMRGDAKFSWPAQGLPYIEFTMDGLYAGPAEAARIVPTLAGFQVPQIASTANTPEFSINAVPLVMRKAMLDMGNSVERRLLVGSESIVITDHRESFSAQVETVPLTIFDPYALANAQTNVPIVVRHGTVAGRRVRFDAPAAPLRRMSGYEIVQNVAEWALVQSVIPVAGNDQWTLTLT